MSAKAKKTGNTIYMLNALKRRVKKAYLITDIILNPPLTFIKKYIIQFGILDGFYGFVISVLTTFARFLKYVKLRELNTCNKNENTSYPQQ